MNDKAMAALRLDKRLAQREGWIPEEELERELASLPDVSQKATTLDDEGQGSSAAGREGGSTAGSSGGGAAPPASSEGVGGS